MSEFSPLRGGNEGCGVCDDEEQEKEPALRCRRFAHNCPQCGQLREVDEGVPNMRIFPFKALPRRESPCLQGKSGRSRRGSKKSRRFEHG